jgi:hypothetical protein
MQHGESGAPLPRQIAKAYGRKLCGNDHDDQRVSRWVDGRTGKPLDNSGRFRVEMKKKRVVSPK